jgi:hypothetical protein
MVYSIITHFESIKNFFRVKQLFKKKADFLLKVRKRAVNYLPWLADS